MVRVGLAAGVAGAGMLWAEPPALLSSPGSVTVPPAALVAANTHGTELHWEDVVQLAIKNNPDLQSVREAILNSQAVKSGSYSALYPQISAQFSAGRNYTENGLLATSDYTNSFSEQIALSQQIFNGFATKANIDQARAELNLAFANMNQQKASTSYNLKTSFAQLLYAQQLITLSQNVLSIRQNNAHMVKLLYEGGTEDKGAMLLSEANYDQAVNDVNQALRIKDLSMLQLQVYIGLTLPDPVVAIGKLETEPLSAKPDFSKLAVRTPAYFQRRAQTEAAAAGITSAESGWYPTINASASAGQNDTGFPLHNRGYSGGITVSLPIFEGGATYFNVKAATASFRQSLASLQSGTNQAALTLAQAFKTMVDTRDNVRIQEELLQATELRYKIAEASYRTGRTSFQDFNTITDNYVSQQQTCLASQRDAVIAEANWEQARGLGAIP